MIMETLIYLHLPSGKPPPELALPPFRAVVVIEDCVTDAWRDEVSEWFVRSGCRYMMAWGKDCSKWDDSVDHASLARYDYGKVPDDHAVMKTWHAHEPLSEVFWFAIHCAALADPTPSCDLIVDIGHRDRRDELVGVFQAQV